MDREKLLIFDFMHHQADNNLSNMAGIHCFSLLLFCMLWPIFLTAQQISYQKKVIGRVLVEDTGKALGFAHISVGGNEVGTLSNEQGLFVLKIPMRLQKDTLQISYLGYLPRRFALEQLGEDTLIVSLTNQNLSLEPIEILSISPRDTLRKAWLQRGINYEIRPTLIRGFYREEMEDVGADIQFLFAEGVLELYKSPYHRGAKDRVRVLKGRQKQLPYGYSRGEEGVCAAPDYPGATSGAAVGCDEGRRVICPTQQTEALRVYLSGGAVSQQPPDLCIFFFPDRFFRSLCPLSGTGLCRS